MISAYLCWHLSGRSMTSQYRPIPILHTVRGRHYFQSFDIFDQHLELQVKRNVYVPAEQS